MTANGSGLGRGRGFSRDRLVGAVVPGVLIAALVGVLVVKWRPAHATGPEPLPGFHHTALNTRVGDPGGLSTARDDLARAVTVLEQRVAHQPSDVVASARLADALLRQARVQNNPGLAVRAEDVLKTVLAQAPDEYEATRMMGAVLLSQHRFREAIDVATRAHALQPADAWNSGVLGDAWLELGDYIQAFDAFDEMMRRRPSAAAYARASYARELQGDLDDAVTLMRMATDATSAHDPEGQAWHHAQVGDLFFQQGRLADARREYEHAAFIFPDHPFAALGLARVKAAEQDFDGALAIYEAQLSRGPMPHLAARAGEMHERLGHREEAARLYALAENGWRFDTPEPTALVAFLAAHDLAANGGAKLADAIALGERTAAKRQDIFTMDALAWAYFKAGRFDDAAKASEQALRTGTRDRTILYHAAAIRQALGDAARARTLVARALDGHPQFDPVAAPAAQALASSLKTGVSHGSAHNTSAP